METRLVFLPHIQQWTSSSSLDLRIVVIPRGNPLAPLDPETSGSPSFATATLKFDVHLSPGLDVMPVQSSTVYTTVTPPAAPRAKSLFTALATQFEIDTSPPPVLPPPAGTQVMKHLPISYQKAVNYSPGRTRLVVTGNEYLCALNSGPSEPLANLPPVNPKIPWGKVIAILLRNQMLAAAAGLVRSISVPITPVDLLKSGGYIYVTLSSNSDGASLIGKPDALKLYASRIPSLTTSRDIFTPVLFPVPNAPISMNFDEVFEEVDNYDDGWAKAVHCAQPQQLHPANESPDGTRPASELGIRIGWDDEQVTIWMNRQLDKTLPDLDCPLGVARYRIDARIKGSTEWHSLVHGAGEMGVGDLDLGPFDGDLGIEAHPVQLEAKRAGTHWLPTYFTAWKGPSLASLDPIQLFLDGGPDKRKDPGVKGARPSIKLEYGKSYQFRVRLADHAGGGPSKDGSPIVPAPSPMGSCDFRRWIRPLEPSLVEPVPPDPDPSNPPSSIKLQRPLLPYPAISCTRIPDPINDLITDMPSATAAGRKPGLPDPDVDFVRITIEVEGLLQDPATTDANFMPVSTTTRSFPPGPRDPAIIKFSWVDMADVSTLHQRDSGPLLLPTARTVRLRIVSLCRDEPDYFGAEDVRSSESIQVTVRKNSSDESHLLIPESPSHRLKALYLQPELPVNPSMLAAQLLAGKPNERQTDNISRVSAALDLLNDGLVLRSKPGRRVVFGAAAGLLHTIGPDLASIRFASPGNLAQHWILVIQITLNRDWSWDAFIDDGIVVQRDGVEVGRFSPNHNVSNDALTNPDRSQTHLYFFDVIDPKPPNGEFPKELQPQYTVEWNISGAPTTDPPLSLATRLPVTTPPAQVPQISSAGIAMSPYERDEGTYANSKPRQRSLWLELELPPADKNDTFFARVLRNSPDPLLVTTTLSSTTESPEPPLAIDPEPLRLITPGQSADPGGLDAMQPLIPSDTTPTSKNLHWMLPLPPGLDSNSPELFGFFKYELRTGHKDIWSTAQGRFGPPLQVSGVQFPPPPLLCDVVRTQAVIHVSAPFAFPVQDGKPLQSLAETSSIWVLLYAQAEQLDGQDRRNVLLDRRRVLRHGHGDSDLKSRVRAFGTATFDNKTWSAVASALGFHGNVPLSVLAVEMLPQGQTTEDPLGADLGGQRILRTSNLVEVPHMCG